MNFEEYKEMAQNQLLDKLTEYNRQYRRGFLKNGAMLLSVGAIASLGLGGVVWYFGGAHVAVASLISALTFIPAAALGQKQLSIAKKLRKMNEKIDNNNLYEAFVENIHDQEDVLHNAACLVNNICNISTIEPHPFEEVMEEAELMAKFEINQRSDWINQDLERF